MKPSRYNFFYPYNKDEKKYIACNVLTSSLALIDEEHYKQYLAFSNEEIDIEDNEFVEDLKKGGFILDKDIDELEIIRHDMYKVKFDENQLALTIAPTLDCNFRCIYCYEKDVINKQRMTKEIADSIIELIRRKSKTLKSLNIDWYGGEPLLEIDMIEYLSNKIIKICDENNIVYQAGIVTNGYYLNEKNIEILQKARVIRIQITIDGDETVHNKRRPLLDGNPTFSTIINNLKFIKKYKGLTYLRINVDNENAGDAIKVVDILENMDLVKVVIPYLGIVTNNNNSYIDNKCIKDKDYLDIRKNFDSYIVDKGFFSSINDRQLPHRINCVCSANKANSMVINSDGEIYKCWEDIGNYDLSIGNIKDEISKNLVYLRYVMSDPTMDPECSECKYLPICLSGCPSNRGDKQKTRCLESRLKLDNALNNIVENCSI